MRIPSGVTDQYIYFVAVDATDFATRETGLSSFTVYRSRNGAAAAAMTTPTINETDSTNMPGVYELLLDEDMTIGAGNDSEEMVFHITATGMAPVTRTIELYRPKITAGNTLGVAADGDISGNLDGTVATVTTLTGHTAQTGDSYAIVNHASYGNAQLVRSTTPANTLDVNATGEAGIDLDNTSGTLAKGTDITGFNDLSAAQVNAECDTALTDYDAVVPADLPTNFGDLAITVTTGEVTVGTNNDKTGYTASTVSDKTGYSISGTLTTLDALDTQQDTQHAATQADIAALNNFDPTSDTVANVTTTANVTNQVTADVTAISGSATAADNLEASALSVVPGSCEGTPSTTVIQTDLAETTDDHYIGRIVVFTSGAAAYQATDITDYTGSTGTITVTALTTAPSASDTFVVL